MLSSNQIIYIIYRETKIAYNSFDLCIEVDWNYVNKLQIQSGASLKNLKKNDYLAINTK